jgi:cyclohexa-1,5-dienecarbonyl-CoA hydratase
MSLAVFAPAASCLLPERIGQSQAEMLLLSGQSVDAEKARQLRLVDRISDDPSETALTWIDKSIINKSASSLRIAITAARHDYIARIGTKLAAVEKLYLDELMQTNDAIEGLNAFLEKRKPVWENTSKGVG